MQQFLSDLYDVSFDRFVIPRLIRVIFIIGLVLLAIASLVMIISSFAQSAGQGVILLILTPIFFVIYTILMRVYLEIVLVLFRIHDTTRQILAAQAPAAAAVSDDGPTETLEQ